MNWHKSNQSVKQVVTYLNISTGLPHPFKFVGFCVFVQAYYFTEK